MIAELPKCHSLSKTDFVSFVISWMKISVGSRLVHKVSCPSCAHSLSPNPNIFSAVSDNNRVVQPNTHLRNMVTSFLSIQGFQASWFYQMLPVLGTQCCQTPSTQSHKPIGSSTRTKEMHRGKLQIYWND